MNFIILTISKLTQSSVDSASPKINWARIDEADNFAETVKLYRQGKYDEDSFRRFRLQHGAYGTRMTSDYAMVRVKLPAGEIYPKQFEKLSQLIQHALMLPSEMLLHLLVMPKKQYWS